MFEYLEARGAADANIALHRSYRELVLELRADGQAEYARIAENGVAVTAEPPRMPDLVLSAAAEAWREFLTPTPRPGFQAISTMRRTGSLKVSGDLLAYHQNLLLLELLLGLGRRPAPPPRASVGEPFIEPVTGHYLNLDFEGRPHRVYFEKAGQGIPLLCLHTAGADGRQFRSVLNDAEVTWIMSLRPRS